MSGRPRLLFYCQHSLGLGHLVRSLALTEALAERFDVTLLSGGVLPADTRVPAGVRILALPPVGHGPDGREVSHVAGESLEYLHERRAVAVLDAWAATCPDAIVVELFPFGRNRFARELVPLLDAARGSASPPVIVSSVRDVLVGRGDKQLAKDEMACARANRYFDAILLHGDPRLARLEESFRPRSPLRVPVHYTGFVVPEGAPAPAARGEHIVISAGGGRVGGPLLRAALDAQRRLWPTERRPMRLIAGPFLPMDEWRALSAEAERVPGAELVRSVPVLRDELAAAAGSVSQGGYNTTLDLLRAGVPALVVPFAAPREDEQTRRAHRLEHLGALRVLDPARLDGATLAAELRSLPSFRPAAVDLRLDGAAASVRILDGLLTRRVGEVAA